jgi:hypothetical protein
VQTQDRIVWFLSWSLAAVAVVVLVAKCTCHTTGPASWTAHLKEISDGFDHPHDTAGHTVPSERPRIVTEQPAGPLTGPGPSRTDSAFAHIRRRRTP